MAKVYHIAPSILSAKKDHIEEEIALLKRSKADYVHIDIMDGVFVPAVTFTDDFVERVISLSQGLQKDVHIMVEKPWEIGKKFALMGASDVVFHLEACPTHEDVLKTIAAIKDNGAKVGIAIKPNTPVSEIIPYLSLLDIALVMTVEPGKGGQSFMYEAAGKIKELASLREEKHDSYLIECDGGVNGETVKVVKENGIDIIVAGSYLFGHEDFIARVAALL